MLKKFFILFAITIVITACSESADETMPNTTPDRTNSGISFTFNAPVGQYVQTYADDTGSADEWKINSLDIYAFRNDGTYAGKLNAGTDYTRSEDQTIITIIPSWIHSNFGKTFRFYFVANDADAHIADPFTGDENEFKVLTTKFLTSGTNGKYKNIVTPLLFSGVSPDITITADKISKGIEIRRCVARFDIVNKLPKRFVIKEVLISDARRQGYIWNDDEKSPAGFGTVSMEPFNLATTQANYIYERVFYLYPTSLDVTTIFFVAEFDGIEKIYEINSNCEIKANKRYRIIFGAGDFTFPDPDWDDEDEDIIIPIG